MWSIDYINIKILIVRLYYTFGYTTLYGNMLP